MRLVLPRTKPLRVAILEPAPRICGAVLWAFAAREGLRQIGVKCDLVSATKSGRVKKYWGGRTMGIAWWPTQPDVVTKIDELAAYLKTNYDVLVLSDIRCPTVDGQAEKEGLTSPWYVDVALQCGLPFTSMIHGNEYHGKKDTTYADLLLEAPNFSRILIAASDYGINSDPRLKKQGVEKIPLPYVPTRAIDDPISCDDRVTGYTGRIIPNKGALSAMGACYFLSSQWKMIVQGSCSVGQHASYAHMFLESLQKRGYVGGYGEIPKKKAFPIWPNPWAVTKADRASCEYLGGYDSAVEACSKLAVHINASGWKYSQGQVEYTTMEAIDAGCACIVPPTVSSPEYDLTLLPNGFNHQNPGDWVKDPHTSKDVAKAVIATYEKRRRDPTFIRNNRKVLRATNGADVVARKLLQVLRAL